MGAGRSSRGHFSFHRVWRRLRMADRLQRSAQRPELRRARAFRGRRPGRHYAVQPQEPPFRRLGLEKLPDPPSAGHRRRQAARQAIPGRQRGPQSEARRRAQRRFRLRRVRRQGRRSAALLQALRRPEAGQGKPPERRYPARKPGLARFPYRPGRRRAAWRAFSLLRHPESGSEALRRGPQAVRRRPDRAPGRRCRPLRQARRSVKRPMRALSERRRAKDLHHRRRDRHRFRLSAASVSGLRGSLPRSGSRRGRAPGRPNRSLRALREPLSVADRRSRGRIRATQGPGAGLGPLEVPRERDRGRRTASRRQQSGLRADSAVRATRRSP